MRAAALLAALLACLACRPDAPPTIPKPDLTGVEAEVRRAVESARAALADDPSLAESWARLGERYRAGAWMDESAACFREARRREPDVFRWSYLLAHALMKRDPHAAAKAFEQALALDDDYAPAHLHYAERLVQLGRGDEAREQFEAVLRLEADNVHAAVGLAKLELDADLLDAARRRLEAALAVDPRHGDARRTLAQVYLGLGRAERAQEQSVASIESMEC